ncbi:FAD binding domain-containing protein [Pseudonocardia acaciae]|uniref:FAD binding domain-containing protein n=1 Tax=Pseudonocardia acaciae TaxID=551276 RepID=UPI00048EDB0A|nr:FAD binding domain-containing protein [Pseudonocardia acaciae]
MKPPPFDYVRAEHLDHALELLREHGEDAKPVAGGQSLIPLLNLRMARPALLVDINDLPLGELAVDGSTLRTGALVRHHALCSDPRVSATNPLLGAAARHIGHRAIRHRGTVGGSVAHADPAAELPLVALACGGRIVARSAGGTREIAAAEFGNGPFMTALEADELIVELRWPGGGAWGFAEFAERTGDFATAAAAAVVLTGRVAITGVPGSPARLPTVEAAIRADPGLAAEELRAVAEAELREHEPHLAGLVAEMVVRAVAQARHRERGAA